MGIWATNLLHRFSDAMQLCCALEVGTFFLKILLRIAIMAILSSISPLSNSQTKTPFTRAKKIGTARQIFGSLHSKAVCRAGRTSGKAAKFTRKASENEQSRPNLLAVSLPSPTFIT